MHTWLRQMPRGMRLKSEGFASSLYDPDSTFTLAAYCKEQGPPYDDIGLQVPLETFAAYGLGFQKRFVPELENKLVVSVHRSCAGFQVRLGDGAGVTARIVLAAFGRSHLRYFPPILAALPEQLGTHSSKPTTLDHS